ncbi:unnamed protein product [Soboliphyme baturini]|uniref:Abhydrolase_3 domain-containing protein n=1 Tax=Soboliphyme baturini TaxID=241478 RepID=A0A183J1E9_9BILA|nr:unnamed protein product [Soboliphyme baturini]
MESCVPSSRTTDRSKVELLPHGGLSLSRCSTSCSPMGPCRGMLSTARKASAHDDYDALSNAVYLIRPTPGFCGMQRVIIYFHGSSCGQPFLNFSHLGAEAQVMNSPEVGLFCCCF